MRDLLRAMTDSVERAVGPERAARGLEGYVTVDPKNRLVDRIHAARLLAEQLRSA